MHKSRLAAFVIDTHGDDLNQAKQFWSKALGQDCKEYDSINFSPINTPDDQPHIWLHKVNHPSRIHLDIETDNIDAEVDRLKKLGATVFEEKEKWVVMEAPTGHRFCVVNPQRDDFDSSNQVNCWD